MSKHINKNLRIDDKIAVITGGASGIGLATARLLAEKGAKIAIFDKNENVNQIASTIAESAIGLKLDICDEEQVQKAVAQVVAQFGGIDILCNIAGLGSGEFLAEDLSLEEWRSVIEVNLTAAFIVSQCVGKVMISAKKGGKMVNMSSQAAIRSITGHVAYSASKAGLLAMTRGLAFEWGKHGINVNTVSPTVVMTPMAKDYWSGERGRKHLEQIPMNRFAELEEVAMTVLFLVSDASNIINGANICVDGGFTI